MVKLRPKEEWTSAHDLDELGERVPLIISGTIVDASGRTLSGQTVEAFWHSIRHADPLIVGLNCALGAKQLKRFVGEIAKVADTFVSVHPNAGLPNEFGGYDDSPESMAHVLEDFAKEGLVNIVGGCCGTTPEHLRQVVERLTPERATVTEAPLALSLSEMLAAVDRILRVARDPGIHDVIPRGIDVPGAISIIRDLLAIRVLPRWTDLVPYGAEPWLVLSTLLGLLEMAKLG